MSPWTTLAMVTLWAGTCTRSVDCHAAPGLHCSKLANLNLTSGKRFIRVRGQEHTLSVYWSTEPTRAAAALLLAALQHGLHYSGVKLQEGPRDLCQLAETMRNQQNSQLALVPAAAWDRGHQCSPCADLSDPSQFGFCGLGGPQLVVTDSATAPMAVRAYIYLSVSARRLPGCAHATSWTFYGNVSALAHCSFDFTKDSGLVTMYVAIEKPWEVPETRAFIENMIGASVPVHFEPLARTLITDRLRTTSSGSFLFLDWEMWQRIPALMKMGATADPCVCSHQLCKPEANMVGVRAASELLFKYTPPLLLLTQQFIPNPEDLREILELDTSHSLGIEEAACRWANHHPERIERWLYGTERFDNYVMVFVCKDDPEFLSINTTDTVINLVGSELWRITEEFNFGVYIHSIIVNCSVRDEFVHQLDVVTHSTIYYRVIGIVTGGEGARALDETTKARQLQLVAYNLNTKGVHASVGRVVDLAAVLRRFFTECGWHRIVVLSEPNPPAVTLVKELEAGTDHLCVRNVEATSTDAERALNELIRADARVVLLNMRAETAAAVVEEAARLHMTPARGYAWVSVEWGAVPVSSNMRVFVVSTECREGHNDSHAELRALFDENFPTWPPRASALADAILTLGLGFLNLQRHYPQYRDDLHANDSLSLFWNGLAATNISGVCQNLRYEGGGLAEPLVFVDEWIGDERQPVATWRVRRGEPTQVARHRPAYPHPHAPPPPDGRSRCTIRSGDCYAPHCHDVEYAIGSTVLVLALLFIPFAFARLRRELRRRVKQKEDEIRQNLEMRREQTILSLAGYIVPRDQLELCEQLGAGRSGRVHFALLRSPNHKLRAVAAKSLRETAAPSEESEFLREACTLAALDHMHVVRLVGVCTGDPLLVLMEHAFFGDLLGYLRARRHLAEGARVETVAEEGGVDAEEATHVSAEALTRLMREAAAALAYLAHRGLVHRDVRAANCLVDARRSLKLGDFGMARETRDPGADGEAEYACRRRGMFPVLWMAPESLERGAFSAASDVWSLGVLMLEVVTLGARPYGSWSPLRVLEYVLRGGRPRLPLDATAQTRGVALSCWRRAARERPSASELVAYLADHPRALRPALAPDWDMVKVDNNYCDPDTVDSADVADSPNNFDRPSPDSGTAFFPDSN